jgi:DcmR-like sensory protein
MELASRHQCLIYAGPPSRHLSALAAVIGERLRQGCRCLYLNSPPMVAGIQSYLAAAGIDVARETARTALITSSETAAHNGSFDADRMLEMLERSLDQALKAGFRGLWASGDMTWEFGAKPDFLKLLEYEWRLENFFQEHPEFEGVCQYHADTLPASVTKQGMISHSSLFVNETLSLLNPDYMQRDTFSDRAFEDPALDLALSQVLRPEIGN